ncbi:hypothetical protein GJ496_011264 [Pomphorhynchus laevis]|nr:hypothetical protein GJ496_011264 [Pomphorhynchus laevis]
MGGLSPQCCYGCCCPARDLPNESTSKASSRRISLLINNIVKKSNERNISDNLHPSVIAENFGTSYTIKQMLTSKQINDRSSLISLLQSICTSYENNDNRSLINITLSTIFGKSDTMSSENDGMVDQCQLKAILDDCFTLAYNAIGYHPLGSTANDDFFELLLSSIFKETDHQHQKISIATLTNWLLKEFPFAFDPVGRLIHAKVCGISVMKAPFQEVGNLSDDFCLAMMWYLCSSRSSIYPGKSLFYDRQDHRIKGKSWSGPIAYNRTWKKQLTQQLTYAHLILVKISSDTIYLLILGSKDYSDDQSAFCSKSNRLIQIRPQIRHLKEYEKINLDITEMSMNECLWCLVKSDKEEILRCCESQIDFSPCVESPKLNESMLSMWAISSLSVN